MEEVPVTQARAILSDLVNRVAYGDQRVVLTRHGKPVAALVSARDLERLAAGGDADREHTPGTVHVMHLGSDTSAPRPLDPSQPPAPGLNPAAQWGGDHGDHDAGPVPDPSS